MERICRGWMEVRKIDERKIVLDLHFFRQEDGKRVSTSLILDKIKPRSTYVFTGETKLNIETENGVILEISMRRKN